MPSHLERAQKKLKIVNVLFRNGYFSINPDINASFMDQMLSEMKVKKQDYRGDISVQELSTDGNKNHAYVFDVEVGIRVVEIKEGKEDIDDKDTVYMITAEFEVLYTSEEKLTKEEVKAFSKNNVTYHIWPYWREYVQSACSRMGTQPLHIPMFKPE
ncbi:hypothetical protein [Xenorhabdus siamensis]|uniref:hypothetical protein n=1 Tax=Xenorhabdus siamensis TaxID=3136254 RepID=UPI0030F3EDA5